MDPALAVLTSSAAGLAIFHTAIGIDHALPFIALGKARHWSLRRTLIVTAACGLGHVTGAALIGLVGALFGLGLERLELLDAQRGALSAWLLISLGAAYGVWGIWKGLRGVEHEHPHAHADGRIHVHAHDHETAHAHLHEGRGGSAAAIWLTFIVFVLGPCETLIPLMMAPAVTGQIGPTLLVAAVFGGATVLTMLAMVWLGWRGVSLLPARGLERWAHALAGLAIVSGGLAVQLLGL